MPMKILIVSATKSEVEPLLNKMEATNRIGGQLTSCTYKTLELDFLVTGVGMVPTTFYTAKVLNDTYDAAINVGVCGSFNKNLEIGSVVNIYEDCFSELGAEDGDNFLPLDELGLKGVTKINNSEHVIRNSALDVLPKVNGITVNTTHGNEKAIEKVFDKFHPFVESMEGAAFMFVCENENIPYVQIRSVSNFVEKRNKDNWNIPLAIENVNVKVLEILIDIAKINESAKK